VLRVIVADAAGNQALAGRDVKVAVPGSDAVKTSKAP
jgi:hypothetical protein